MEIWSMDNWGEELKGGRRGRCCQQQEQEGYGREHGQSGW